MNLSAFFPDFFFIMKTVANNSALAEKVSQELVRLMCDTFFKNTLKVSDIL